MTPATTEDVLAEIRALLVDIELALAFTSAARIAVLNVLDSRLTLAVMQLGQCESDDDQ